MPIHLFSLAQHGGARSQAICLLRKGCIGQEPGHRDSCEMGTGREWSLGPASTCPGCRHAAPAATRPPTGTAPGSARCSQPGSAIGSTHDSWAGVSHKGQQPQSLGLSHPALCPPACREPLVPQAQPPQAHASTVHFQDLEGAVTPGSSPPPAELPRAAPTCHKLQPGARGTCPGGRAPSRSPTPAEEMGTSGPGPWHCCGCHGPKSRG